MTLAIAEAGIPVHALDANEAMLDVLRSKLTQYPPEVQSRVIAVRGDMRAFELAPSSPLFLTVEIAELLVGSGFWRRRGHLGNGWM